MTGNHERELVTSSQQESNTPKWSLQSSMKYCTVIPHYTVMSHDTEKYLVQLIFTFS